MKKSPHGVDEALPRLTFDYLRSKVQGADQSADKITQALAEKVIHRHLTTLAILREGDEFYLTPEEYLISARETDPGCVALARYLDHLNREVARHNAAGGRVESARCCKLLRSIRETIGGIVAAATDPGGEMPDSAKVLARLLDSKQVAEKTETPAPLARQLHQEKEILRVIGELGYSAKNLPKHSPGMRGAKAAVRDQLSFSTGVFNKAWERLRSQGEILNAL